MAFDRTKLTPQSGGGKGIKLWTYDANAAGDTEAATAGANYYDAAADVLGVGDWILVSATSAGRQIQTVTANDGSTVTVATFAT